MITVLDAQFVTTAVNASQVPAESVPEIAFVGRSNVGKSSMINTLVGRRKLVRVSNTPGRTRALNFFAVRVQHGKSQQQIRFVDLPGYGFAKVSKTERSTWQKMVSSYLENRPSLQVVVSIIDGEIGPTNDDFQTLDYLVGVAQRILVVATKIDRIPKAKRKPQLKTIAETLELNSDLVMPFSATERIGVDEVWENLMSVFTHQTASIVP